MVPTERLPRPTRDRLLQEAARLFAHRGFHGVSIEDLGAAVGIRGPGVYKHFPSKGAVLAELLIGVSERLLAGAERVVDTAPEPRVALERLVRFHTTFALEQPDLIRVQDRDLANMPEEDQAQVRRFQRAYLERWVDVLRLCRPQLPIAGARLHVQAVFGLLNSTPHSVGSRSADGAPEMLEAMALAALGS